MKAGRKTKNVSLMQSEPEPGLEELNPFPNAKLVKRSPVAPPQFRSPATGHTVAHIIIKPVLSSSNPPPLHSNCLSATVSLHPPREHTPNDGSLGPSITMQGMHNTKQNMQTQGHMNHKMSSYQRSNPHQACLKVPERVCLGEGWITETSRTEPRDRLMTASQDNLPLVVPQGYLGDYP